MELKAEEHVKITLLGNPIHVCTTLV